MTDSFLWLPALLLRYLHATCNNEASGLINRGLYWPGGHWGNIDSLVSQFYQLTPAAYVRATQHLTTATSGPPFTVNGIPMFEGTAGIFDRDVS